MVYNSAKTAVTVTPDYSSASLKASNYESSVVTITAAARTKALNIEGNSKANKIIGASGGKSKAVTVSDSFGSTLASYGASVVTIDSSARTKALNITGNAAANKIIGTAGNDTIDGGGNDIITDYTAGQDTIKITGEISAYSISGSDAIFKIDSGSIKVTGGKNSAITVVDSNKNISTYQNGAIYNNPTPSKATAITLTSGYSASSISAGTAVVTIDASPKASAIKILGNAKNNLLTGGRGADVFYFDGADGDGGDVITDYVSGEDVIKLTSGTAENRLRHDNFEKRRNQRNFRP